MDINHYIRVHGVRSIEIEIRNRRFRSVYKVELEIASDSQRSLPTARWTLQIPVSWRLGSGPQNFRAFVLKNLNEVYSDEHRGERTQLEIRVANARVTWVEETVLIMVAELVANAIENWLSQRAAESRGQSSHRRQTSDPSPGSNPSILGAIGSFLSARRD